MRKSLHFFSQSVCNEKKLTLLVQKSAMRKHYIANHPGVDIPKEPFKVQLLKKCKDFVDRQISQSVYIKHLRPEINVQLSDKQKTEMREQGIWVKNNWKIS